MDRYELLGDLFDESEEDDANYSINEDGNYESGYCEEDGVNDYDDNDDSLEINNIENFGHILGDIYIQKISYVGRDGRIYHDCFCKFCKHDLGPMTESEINEFKALDSCPECKVKLN